MSLKGALICLLAVSIGIDAANKGKLLKKLAKPKELGYKLEDAIKSNLKDEVSSNNDAISALEDKFDVLQADYITLLADHNALKADVNKLESTNDIYFDAFRTSAFVTVNDNNADNWTTITYTNARDPSGSIDINTGVFTAPLAGTYQFIIQAGKTINVIGYLKLVYDGTIITTIFAADQPNYSTMTGTAIIQMEAGQRVWAETPRTLNSNPDTYIHFTGVLLTQN